jgi:ribosome recycling factor
MNFENEQVEMILLDTAERTDKTCSVLASDFASVRAGRANPHILDKILVDYYGTPTPINQVGNLSVADARCLVIAPWDASMLKVIEKQLLQENIGITPSNDGKVIRLVFPQLTEERRKELVKQVKKMAEDAKVAVRNIRRDGMEALKKLKNDKAISEDEHAGAEKELDKHISKEIERIDKLAAEKEKDVLSV